MTAGITERKTCRACGNKLVTVASFGDIPVMNMGDKKEMKAPLTLCYCSGCTLLQLKHTVDSEYLFRNYYFKSDVNEANRDALADVVKGTLKHYGHIAIGRWVDIGANDGTLLSAVGGEFEKVAFEPALNFEDGLMTSGCIVISNFFSSKELYKKYAKTFPPDGSKVDIAIVSAISMFYDLDDPGAFLDDVKEVLAPDGLFVIQQNYLPAMLEKNDFTNLVHEHLCYYSMTSLTNLLSEHGLYIEDVEFNDVNGGSFRTYIRRINPSGEHQTSSSTAVSRALAREKELGLDDVQTYKEFALKADVVRHKLHALLKRVTEEEGKLVYVGGASTRGHTLMYLADISKYVKFAVDRNPAKWGKTYCGTIPIVSEKFASDLRPDYYILLPFHFLAEYMVRETDFLMRGGKIIVPLPRPAILSEEEI